MLASAEIQPSTASVTFLLADVIAKGDEYYLVKQGAKTWSARCASSFLFVPDIHDRVLVLKSDDEVYISQIVHRSSGQPLVLRIAEALAIQGQHLHCEVDFLNLSGQALDIQQQQLHIDSDRVDLAWRDTRLTGQHAQVNVEHIAVKSGLCDAVIDSLTVKAKHVLHWIEELKQQMLGRLHISVQKHYQLDCDSADIYSRQDVKIDAKQIHLG